MGRMKFKLRQPLLALAFVGLAVPQPLVAAESEWVVDHASRFRLLLADMPSGALAGGIEIQMDRGWHTYWRVPGDVGVPPLFDFSASKNIKTVDVEWPVPQRYVDEEGGLSLVYFDQVVFPLAIQPKRPGEAVELAVNAFYGVCDTICIPVKSDARLTFTPGMADTPLARISIDQSRASLPGRPVPGQFDLAVSQTAQDKLTIRVVVPDDEQADLFSVPPAGWYLQQPEFVSREGTTRIFTQALEGMPKGATATGQMFRFVAATTGQAIARSVKIGD